MSDELDREIDELFQLPLAQFVGARNALAARLKKSGVAHAPAMVKAIPKPSPSAWAVNQLYWGARPIFDRLLQGGDDYRRAQQEVLREGGTDQLMVAERNRSGAIEETLRRVLRIFDERGEPAPTAAVLARVRATLEALASYGSGNPTPMKGRLTSDLEPPGFAALAPLAPPLPPARPASDRAERELEERRAAAKQRLERAEAALAAARTELERARERTVKLESAWEEARSAWEEIEAHVESGEAARERK